MTALLLLAAAAVSGGVTAAVWVVSSARPERAAAGARENLARDLPASNLRQLVLQRSATQRAVTPSMAAIARLARRLSPVGMLERIDRKLELAGHPPTWPLERVLAGKVVLSLTGALVALLVLPSLDPARGLLLLTALTVSGFLLPDGIIASRAAERQAAIRVALPDALDQMTICVEAGLGFEAAMARVARAADGPLNEELRYTLQEMRVGATRADALRRMAKRTEVDELKRFVLALVQAEGYGMPIGTILRTQARQVRVRRRQLAEEHAAKIPVKLVFPLVLCILPSLFIVILGPAGIRMAEFFGGGGGAP